MILLGQTFSLSDIPRVVFLSFLEVLLSADNAIVLGIVASRLHASLRKKALFIGYISAWIFRLVAILGVAALLSYPWIQIIGGGYLLYLALHHFIKKRDKEKIIPPSTSFWKTVLIIELLDLAFAVDSIVAGVAFVGSSSGTAEIFPKIWIVYIGGMIGVFAIRYAAGVFISLLQRFPRLETAAYAMIGWIGLKLTIQSFSLQLPYFEFVFWVVLALLFSIGLTRKEGHV